MMTSNLTPHKRNRPLTPEQHIKKEMAPKKKRRKNAADKTSKYKGVCWHKSQKKWRARVYFKGKQHTSGYFENELDCAMEVNKLCRKLGMPVHHPELEIGESFLDTGDTFLKDDIEEDSLSMTRENSLSKNSFDSEYSPPSVPLQIFTPQASTLKMQPGVDVYEAKKEISPPYENFAVPDELGDPHDLGFSRHDGQRDYYRKMLNTMGPKYENHPNLPPMSSNLHGKGGFFKPLSTCDVKLEDTIHNFAYNVKMMIQDQIQKGVLQQYSQSINAMKQDFNMREARYQEIIRGQEEQLLFMKQKLLNYEYAFERIIAAQNVEKCERTDVRGGKAIDENEYKRDFPFTKTEDLSGSLGEIGNLPKKNVPSNNNNLPLNNSPSPLLVNPATSNSSSSPSLHPADLNTPSPLHFSIY